MLEEIGNCCIHGVPMWGEHTIYLAFYGGFQNQESPVPYPDSELSPFCLYIYIYIYILFGGS